MNFPATRGRIAPINCDGCERFAITSGRRSGQSTLRNFAGARESDHERPKAKASGPCRQRQRRYPEQHSAAYGNYRLSRHAGVPIRAAATEGQTRCQNLIRIVHGMNSMSA
jgi:hypothetical protein